MKTYFINTDGWMKKALGITVVLAILGIALAFTSNDENIDKNNVEIKFSKHATKRLSNRNMDISLEDMVRLEKAFGTAENKGVKDALILMDNKAFIANISSKTVITTINKDQLEEKVFTNIDGAVII